LAVFFDGARKALCKGSKKNAPQSFFRIDMPRFIK